METLYGSTKSSAIALLSYHGYRLSHNLDISLHEICTKVICGQILGLLGLLVALYSTKVFVIMMTLNGAREE